VHGGDTHWSARWLISGLSINGRIADSSTIGAMITTAIILTLLVLLVATEPANAS